MKKHLLKLLLLCCVGILALSMFACVPTTEQYKLDFIVDGEVYHSRTTSGNSRIVPPSDPRKFGYIFKGWYFDEDSWENEYHAYSLEKNPIKEDTKVYAYFEYDETHTCVGEEKIEVAPTCNTEGRKVLKCKAKDCQKILRYEVIEKSTTHTGTDVTVKTDVVLPTCTTEGSYTETIYCSVCNEKKSENKITTDVDKNAHCYENGILTNVNEAFCFTAQCKHCQEIVSLDNVEVSKKILEEPTCIEPGSMCYVYTAFGKEYSSAVETIDPLGHSINGVAIKDNEIYSEKQYKDIFPYITLIANASSDNDTCEAVMDGVFECDNCSENTLIKVNKPHVGTWVQTKAPTCFANGIETLDLCTACGEENLTRDVAATGDHRDGSVALVKDGDKFNVVVPCVNASLGCTHIMSVFHEDVKVTAKEIISKSCSVPDVIRYTYKASGKTLTYDEIIAEGHFVDGVRASVLQDEEGWFDYRLVTLRDQQGGIKMFADKVLVCDEFVDGYYKCESCKHLVNIKIYRPHTGDWITTKEPTCTETGVSNFYCEFCDYGDDGSITNEIPVSAHNYDLKLKIDTDGTFDIVGNCSGCNAEHRVDDINVSATMTKRPTCTAKGEILYSCNYNGKTYTVTGYIPMISHSLNGVLTNEGTRLEYYEYVKNGTVSLPDGTRITCVSNPSDTSKDVDATFSCYECGADIPVKVYRLHAGEWGLIRDPETSPCIVSGVEKFSCIYTNCFAKYERPIYTENHSYVVDSIVLNGDKYTITVKCTVDSCNKKIEYTDVTAIDTIVKVPADCCTEGIVEYAFVSDGHTYKFTSKVDKGNHLLLGVDYETLIVDGKIDLSNATGATIVEVGSKTYFKCDRCGQLIFIPDVQIIKPDEE